MRGRSCRLQEGGIDAAFYRPTTSHGTTSASFLNIFFLFRFDRPFSLLSLSPRLSVRLIKLAVRRWLFSLFSSSTVWITLIFPTRPLSRRYVRATIQRGRDRNER